METRSIWKNPSTKTFYLYRNDTDEDPLVLSAGTCITWEGRKDYVKITQVLGTESEEGPRGFTYLPYREEGRWASLAFTLRGDPRFIICYPSGTPHYGLHIPLHTIIVDDAPLYVGPPGIINKSFDLETILEIRHTLVTMLSKVGIQYQMNKNVYLCLTDQVQFRIQITRMDTNFRVDFYHVSGNIIWLQHYMNHLDLY